VESFQQNVETVKEENGTKQLFFLDMTLLYDETVQFPGVKKESSWNILNN
jgi:hypothetical protein